MMTLRNSEKRMAMAAAAAVSLLGFLIMAGWRLHWQAVVQLLPDSVPMQFNTALAFFLSGAALAATTGQKRALAAACAACALVFSFVIGLQYLTGADFGIDTALFTPWSQVHTAYPGRMAPNTAFMFMLFSGAVLVHGASKNIETRLNFMAIAGLTLFLLSLIALVGYVIRFRGAYSWWGLSDMAPHTAAGFFLLGAGCLAFANPFRKRAGKNALRLWMPAYVALTGIVMTLLVAQGIVGYGQRHARAETQQEVRRIAGLVRLETQKDLKALGRMQSRLSTGSVPENLWRDDAAHYAEDNSAYSSLALLGPGGAVTDAVPPDTKDFWKKALAENRDNRDTWAVGAGEGAAIVALRFPAGKEDTLVAAYDLGKVAPDLLSASGETRFSYDILLGGARVYASGNAGEGSTWDIAASETVDFRGILMTVNVSSAPRGAQDGGLVLFVLFSGLMLSFMMARMLHQTQMLKDSTERYAIAVQGARAGIWVWDLEMDTVDWSGCAAEIFGAKSLSDLPSTTETVKDMINPEDRAEIDATLAKHLETSDNFSIEYRQDTFDGREIWVQSRGKAIDSRDGRPLRMSGTLIDITSRKEAEEELKRSNRELEQFAYVASHDLKAPLRGIDNLARWIEEDLQDVMTEDVKEKIGLMRNRVARLETLLEDILRYSRAGRIADAPEQVDTGELVRMIAEPLAVDGKFSIEIMPGFPTILTPRTPLEQVFSNLIVNAIKHHDRDSGKIRIGVRDADNFHEFFIADDGPGIPPEFHDRVFQMFQTLQPRDVREGSGLGMAIIKKLVEWQGGKTWIVSDPAKARGTEVHFLWPRNSARNA